MKRVKLVRQEGKYYIYVKYSRFSLWKKWDYYFDLEKAEREYESIIVSEGKPAVLKEHVF